MNSSDFFYTAIVLVGYLIGHIGDDAITTRFAKQANDAEKALSDFKKSRTLTREQRIKISEEMKRFAGTLVVFGVFQDPEALDFLEQISSLLRLSAH
jgi:hypothetical protein